MLFLFLIGIKSEGIDKWLFITMMIMMKMMTTMKRKKMATRAD